MGGDIVFNSNWDAVGVDGGLVGNDVKAVWERGMGNGVAKWRVSFATAGTVF